MALGKFFWNSFFIAAIETFVKFDHVSIEEYFNMTRWYLPLAWSQYVFEVSLFVEKISALMVS